MKTLRDLVAAIRLLAEAIEQHRESKERHWLADAESQQVQVEQMQLMNKQSADALKVRARAEEADEKFRAEQRAHMAVCEKRFRSLRPGETMDAPTNYVKH